MIVIRLPVTSNTSSVGLSHLDVTFPSRNDHLSIGVYLTFHTQFPDCEVEG